MAATAKNGTAITAVIRTSGTVSDVATWLCALALVSLVLVAGLRESFVPGWSLESVGGDQVRGRQFLERPCEEIYVVGEGETLHTISDKCSDPFIVEQNPHIHDPDDIFPGLVIRVTPSRSRKLMSSSPESEED